MHPLLWGNASSTGDFVNHSSMQSQRHHLGKSGHDMPSRWPDLSHMSLRLNASGTGPGPQALLAELLPFEPEK